MTAARSTWRRNAARAGIAAGCALAIAAIAGQSAAAAPACSVTFTNASGNGDWETAANWSTGKVPGPGSDVCINGPSPAATGKISVHSLQLATGTQVDFGDAAGTTVTISGGLVNRGNVILAGTLSAPSIDNLGGIDASGDSSISSPALSNDGVINETQGTLRLSKNPTQLTSSGRFGGGMLAVDEGKIILPGDIHNLAGGQIAIENESGAIQDTSGRSALAMLSSIGASATLEVGDGAALKVSGNLFSAGLVDLGGYAGSGSLSVAGSYTQGGSGTTVLNEANLAAGTVDIEHGATLDGSGMIAGSMSNSGTVAAFNFLTIDGDYTQSSAGTLNDYFPTTLTVTHTATLDGTIDTFVNRRCPPAHGAKTTAVAYAQHSGTFSNHSNGFNLLYGATALKVQYEGPTDPNCSGA